MRACVRVEQRKHLCVCAPANPSLAVLAGTYDAQTMPDVERGCEDLRAHEGVRVLLLFEFE